MSVRVSIYFPGGFAPPDPPTRSLAGHPWPARLACLTRLRSFVKLTLNTLRRPVAFLVFLAAAARTGIVAAHFRLFPLDLAHDVVAAGARRAWRFGHRGGAAAGAPDPAPPR